MKRAVVGTILAVSLLNYINEVHWGYIGATIGDFLLDATLRCLVVVGFAVGSGFLFVGLRRLKQTMDLVSNELPSTPPSNVRKETFQPTSIPTSHTGKDEDLEISEMVAKNLTNHYIVTTLFGVTGGRKYQERIQQVKQVRKEMYD